MKLMVMVKAWVDTFISFFGIGHLHNSTLEGVDNVLYIRDPTREGSLGPKNAKLFWLGGEFPGAPKIISKSKILDLAKFEKFEESGA